MVVYRGCVLLSILMIYYGTSLPIIRPGLQSYYNQINKDKHHDGRFKRDVYSLNNQSVVYCDVDDGTPETQQRRKKRYVVHHSSWRSRTVTYKIDNYGSNLWRKSIIDSEIKRAAQLWNGIGSVRLEAVKHPTDIANITISFLSGDHGDGHAFNARIPAHAFFPANGGDIHFNDDSHFTYNTTRGINLYAVAAHEFGHSLGLGHSSIRDAVMHFIHKVYRGTVLELHPDDKAGLQQLYGRRSNWSDWSDWSDCSTSCGKGWSTRRRSCRVTGGSCTGSFLQRKPCYQQPCSTWGKWSGWGYCSKSCDKGIHRRQRLCHSTQAETACDGSYVQIKYCNTDSCFPGDLRDGRSLCELSKADAVINLPIPNKNTTYIFSGSRVWMIPKSLASAEVLQISSKWNLPSNLDAALDFTGDSTVCYFFKGGLYWKLDTSRYRPDPQYPRRLGTDGFYGIPQEVDSVFIWAGNGRIYFTKGSSYYRLNQRYDGDPNAVEFYRTAPNFPKRLSRWEGLPPGGVDAAVQLPDKHTYFFKGNKFYQHHYRFFRVSTGYPKSILRDWLKCDST